MKKSILSILFFVLVLISYSQSFSSTSSLNYSIEVENIDKHRDISINDNQITISNFLGGTSPLIIDIKSKEEKSFNSLECLWYKGTCSRTGDVQWVVIIKKNKPTELDLFQIKEEVRVVRTKIFFK